MISLQLLGPIAILLLTANAATAATLATGDSSTDWNEQVPGNTLPTGSGQDFSLSGAASNFYQLPDNATSTYNDVSSDVDNLLNLSQQPGDLSGSASSAKDALGGAKELLGLPNRLANDIKSLDISELLDKAFSNLLSKLLSRDMNAEWNEIPEALKNASDPIAAGDELVQVISNEAPGDLDLNPVIRGVLAGKQYHRTQTRARVSTVLGTSGQKAMEQSSQQTLKSVLLINQAAQKASVANVTQDVMKQVALQNTQQALIIRSLLPEAQMTNRQLAATNTNLSDISQTLDSEQRAKAQEANAQANAFLRQAAFQNQLWEKGY